MCLYVHIICLLKCCSCSSQCILVLFHYKENHPVLTLVLATALAPCGLDQLGISPPPRLSQDGTLPPLCPGEDRASQSKAVLPDGMTVVLHVPSDLQT